MVQRATSHPGTTWVTQENYVSQQHLHKPTYSYPRIFPDFFKFKSKPQVATLLEIPLYGNHNNTSKQLFTRNSILILYLFIYFLILFSICNVGILITSILSHWVHLMKDISRLHLSQMVSYREAKVFTLDLMRMRILISINLYSELHSSPRLYIINILDKTGLHDPTEEYKSIEQED